MHSEYGLGEPLLDVLLDTEETSEQAGSAVSSKARQVQVPGVSQRVQGFAVRSSTCKGSWVSTALAGRFHAAPRALGHLQEAQEGES